MSRIYQGCVTDAYPISEKGEPLAPLPPDWNGETVLWNHYALFQDAVIYCLVCLLALAGPGSAVGAIRRGMRNSVAK